MSQLRVLIVDLNNFARYPTIAVGYLASVLRGADMDVHVYSPLAHGVPGIEREPAETTARDLARRFNYLMAGRQERATQTFKLALDRGRKLWATRKHDRIVEGFEQADPGAFDVVLISAYLMYYDTCVQIGERCAELGVPLVIGGSYFAADEVAAAWLQVPGLSALIAGEVELELPDLISTAASRGDLSRFAGVWLPSGVGGARPPLQELDQVPFPDYRDFPWERYPNRIIPMITGRGCGWGVCAFCSDVTSTAGRTYRSRSPQNVLDEIELQSSRHKTSLFVFTDLKLNSNLDVWNGLIGDIQRRAPGASWIGAVHVGAKKPNGLDRATLSAAARAGLTRVTTGLESGSQHVLDEMKKGTELGVTSEFLHDAASVGISVRVTMIHGFPGERTPDVEKTAEFLEQHQRVIDRVSLNRFQVMIGPSFLRRFDAEPRRYPGVEKVKRQPRLAIASHEYTPAQDLGYVRATQRMLSAVHRINRKPLLGAAAQFEGVM
jgi:radical SAM superfamily enzyme YgiQ (UPF0313 family)